MIRAKKSLGQNFLNQPLVINTMVKSGNIAPESIVVEVGPGKGALTKKILEEGGIVIALEKDPRLVEHLHEVFAAEIADGRLFVIEEDALTFHDTTSSAYTLMNKVTHHFSQPYTVIANIPYYITGALIRMFLGGPHKPSHMVLLMQKEVADRIVKKDGKTSILSHAVELYCTPHFIKKVPPSAFSPSPKVDSAIIAFTHIREPDLSPIEQDRFFELVKIGFHHKRKTLHKNLSVALPHTDIARVFELCNLSPQVRAEEIDIHTWIELSRHL
ncbi:MAG: 16S rRNA (adenine(1518)-N(6)/adenine(1519)-N(6))-dimethyltransferase RsmA [Candidatus Pacebacteria bacterium]|nr:16S rRNA (adenine(1518)-N(6)/adenine(1519)-N(6))-dimethyltransferase RsmA [Candidatus Paceibacterota bacterium]MCD8528040.1 16S rRNA (adenine(1518)-N(6)/adenine(1519)-N(6))-dimethyltransferase RsmA [Candidatus Paceibacterota bacterium]MCD8563879.1 16S rRNA (adenine(1518)-N(6)/adenine(1519)-N(6))-dimethyltransferase RsmA [Candidatus Paceibacterota bacterium]